LRASAARGSGDPYEDHDPHSQRIFDANDWRSFDITEEDIRRSRRAYFANISYLDDKIGEILDALEATRQPTTPSSSSSPTTATCWASAACGSR
jgi:arylsulfatase A-like enzyme